MPIRKKIEKAAALVGRAAGPRGFGGWNAPVQTCQIASRTDAERMLIVDAAERAFLASINPYTGQRYGDETDA